eukprot:scaffold11264_cov142-Skeletonema_marinoi.AAC.2
MPFCYVASGHRRNVDAVKMGLLTISQYITGLMKLVGETTLSRGSDCDTVWFCPRRMKTPIVGSMMSRGSLMQHYLPDKIAAKDFHIPRN